MKNNKILSEAELIEITGGGTIDKNRILKPGQIGCFIPLPEIVVIEKPIIKYPTPGPVKYIK